MLVFHKVMLYDGLMNSAFEKACQLVGAANLARYLGVTPQAVNEWKKAKRPIPVDRCAQIELATFGGVTRKDLRPDDWHLIWPELAEADHTRRATDKEAT